MHPLVESGALRQRCQQVLCRVDVLAPHLATLARLHVMRDVFVHVGPEVPLEQPLLCFGDAFMARQQGTVRFVDKVINLG